MNSSESVAWRKASDVWLMAESSWLRLGAFQGRGSEGYFAVHAVRGRRNKASSQCERHLGLLRNPVSSLARHP